MTTLLLCCLVSLLVGVFLGWRGFYEYENYMFRKYPEFFRQVMERKIRRKRGEQCLHALLDEDLPVGDDIS